MKILAAKFAATAVLAAALSMASLTAFADGGTGGAGGGGAAAGAGGTGAAGAGDAGTAGISFNGGGGGGGGSADGTGAVGANGGGGLGGAGGTVGAVGSAGAVGTVNLGGGGGGGGGGGASGSSAVSLPGGALTGVVGGAGGAGGASSGDGYGGGGGGGGSGGFGATVTGATPNTNTVLIQGGVGGVGGAGGAAAPPGVGGSGGSGGDGGSGIFFSGPGASLTNSGTIQGGAGGAAGAVGAGAPGGGNIAGSVGSGGAGVVGNGLTIINSGTIAGGLAGGGGIQADAITFSSGVNGLEIQSGSTISGNAVAVLGGTDTFALGGAADSAFDTTLIGTQYLHFTLFNKTGASTWTLTGTPATMTPWVISTGTLEAGAATNVFGSTSAITVNTPGILDLAGNSQQIGSLAGSGTVTNSESTAATLTTGDATSTDFSGVIQDGAGQTALTKEGTGTTTLTGDNTYTGTTTINDGTLQLGDGGTTGSIVGDVLNIGILAIERSNNLTLGGIISGSGELQQNGTGTTTLTGDNTYTGGTTISDGTLQLGDGGTTGSIMGDVLNNGILAIDRSNNLTLGGIISGSGELQQNGTGATTLTGDNTYTGTTTINDGTLQLGDGGTTGSIVGDVLNNGILAIERSNNLTLGGIISGSGELQQNGTGATTLTGDNTYTGTTTINDGTLQLGDGGTTGSIVGAVLNNGILAIDRSNNLTLGGIISGSGELQQNGTGATTLTADNTYTGATTINDGALRVLGSIAPSSITVVNSGGLLVGTGTVGNTSIASGGTLQPGSATPGSSMTVAGDLDLASGSFYTVNLNPATSSLANVSGTATLGDATVNATYAPGSYVAKSYVILDAGSVSGTFGASVNTDLPANFTQTLSYDATHAYLNIDLSFTPPLVPSLNGNQQSVADAIINSFNVNGSIPVNFGGLSPDGLTQVSGEVGAGFANVGFMAGDMFLNLMLNPFINGRLRSLGSDFGPTLDAHNHSAPATEKAGSTIASISGPIISDFDRQYGVWAVAYGGRGTISGDTTTGSHNTTIEVNGLAAGIDFRLTSNTIVGLALSGGDNQWDLSQNLGGGNSDMFEAGFYGKTQFGPTYLSAALAYSDYNVTTNRMVTVSGTDTLTGTFDAKALAARLEGGYRVQEVGFVVTPYGAIQAQRMWLPSYSEAASSGSNQFALSYGSQTANATRTELGARFDYTYQLDLGETLALYSRAAWAHDFNYAATSNAQFQSLPDSSFDVNGATPAHDSALLAAGVGYERDNGWMFNANFGGDFSTTATLYSAFLTAGKEW